MYTDVDIEGLRGLGNVHVPLTALTVFTVFTGRNGAGTSSLLEALFLHACGVHAPLNAVPVLRPMRQLPPMTRDDAGEVDDPWQTFLEVGPASGPCGCAGPSTLSRGCSRWSARPRPSGR